MVSSCNGMSGLCLFQNWNPTLKKQSLPICLLGCGGSHRLYRFHYLFVLPGKLCAMKRRCCILEVRIFSNYWLVKILSFRRCSRWPLAIAEICQTSLPGPLPLGPGCQWGWLVVPGSCLSDAFVPTSSLDPVVLVWLLVLSAVENYCPR